MVVLPSALKRFTIPAMGIAGDFGEALTGGLVWVIGAAGDQHGVGDGADGAADGGRTLIILLSSTAAIGGAADGAPVGGAAVASNSTQAI